MIGAVHLCDLPEIGSTDFFNRLANQSDSDSPLPLAATWELTPRCNLRCRQCYLPIPPSDSADRPLPSALHLLDTLAEQGVLFLLLTGGEFTLQPHWPQIYRHARQCGFLVTLMTNATRVDDTFIRELTHLRPRRIETTIYGFTAATYDAVTGVPGSHARFQAGLSRIRQAGLPLEVKMLVLQSNAHEFELTRRWAADEGLAFRYDAIINPRLDGNLGPAAERLSPDLLAKWLKNNPTPITSPASKPTTPSPLSTGPTPSPLFTCGAGIRTIHLDSNGLAHPCMMWRWNPLDTRSDRWALDWKDHIASLRRQKAPLESRCGTCGHRSGCFTCPALSRLETGIAGMPVEYFCRVMGNQVE